MNYAERFTQELACFRADLPILTGEKIGQRCRTLSQLLMAAVRCGDISTRQVADVATTPESASHDVPI